MCAYYPEDLKDKTPSQIAAELYDEDLDTSIFFDLERTDYNILKWKDVRYGLELKATHGFLVALHEVSTTPEAKFFAEKNRIQIFQDGGIYLSGKSVAELLILCNGLIPKSEMESEDDLYRIKFDSGIEANVGYGTLLFQRLIGGPAAEINQSFPDPKTLTTMVIRGIEKSEVSGFSELCLYTLRQKFPGINFEFSRISEIHKKLVDNDPLTDLPSSKSIDNLKFTERTEPFIFFNRANESDYIPGFLYFYRVLESFFDDVLNNTVDQWRIDSTLKSVDMLRNIRKMINIDREDRWALRQVLGQIVDQQILDSASSINLISIPTADSLSNTIYRRRNSIAHGRRGEHKEILVPYGFNIGDSGLIDKDWYFIMRELAQRALNQWV